MIISFSFFASSAFATNKDIRCHFGSSTTSKSDMSSYRFSEGSSLFRKSVLHRIRFGNTLRLKADFPNSAASSLRTNDATGSDRRPSRSLSAYPDQWTYHHQHRRVSSTPQMAIGGTSADDLSYAQSVFDARNSENLRRDLPIVPPPPIPTPISSTMDITQLETNDDNHQHSSLTHKPDCIFANVNPSNQIISTNNNYNHDLIRQRRKTNRKRTLSMTLADIDSESSSAWTNDGMQINPMSTTATTIINSEPACTCQLLWQLERDTDSIDKFKLFFKRDHLNVDWDYVQGSSEV